MEKSRILKDKRALRSAVISVVLAGIFALTMTSASAHQAGNRRLHECVRQAQRSAQEGTSSKDLHSRQTRHQIMKSCAARNERTTLNTTSTLLPVGSSVLEHEEEKAVSSALTSLDKGQQSPAKSQAGQPVGATIANEATVANTESKTLPPESSLPSDDECAARIHKTRESRPQNDKANHTTPRQPVSQTVPGGYDAAAQSVFPRISGNFVGTTDEILQWGACKWGFETDTVRAQAVQESTWDMGVVGDAGESFGILQVRAPVWPDTHPMSAESTAYNVDYTLALRRACFEGLSYAGPQTKGDLWGCTGFWFMGTWDTGAYDDYVSKVKAHYEAKPWLNW